MTDSNLVIIISQKSTRPQGYWWEIDRGDTERDRDSRRRALMVHCDDGAGHVWWMYQTHNNFAPNSSPHKGSSYGQPAVVFIRLLVLNVPVPACLSHYLCSHRTLLLNLPTQRSECTGAVLYSVQREVYKDRRVGPIQPSLRCTRATECSVSSDTLAYAFVTASFHILPRRRTLLSPIHPVAVLYMHQSHKCVTSVPMRVNACDNHLVV